MQQHSSMCRALFSVSNKTGILEFAQALSNRGFELLSTGNTASLLKNHGLTVIEVSNYTGFPEIMDGRIKTLHPKILGGILGRKGQDDAIMAEYNIHSIDIIVVNFYPFAQVIEKSDCTIEDAIKNIDIGGPTMVRAAAKNYKDVVILVKSNDYQAIIEELDANNNFITLETRFDLAIKAFEYTAAYDSSIANYFGKRVPEYFTENKNPSGYFPRTLNLNFIKKQNLRYGENYHQRAAFYIENTVTEVSIATSKQLHGKKLSFNNIADADTALECVKEFCDPACVIVKHANPCGVAVSDSIFNAYKFAYKTDPTSAFGGIIAFNRTLDINTAQSIISQQFVEVIIAPSINKDALKVIKLKQNIRLLICGYFQKPMAGLSFKHVNGGLLIQDRDVGVIAPNQLHVVTNCQPSKQELLDALFCWKVVKFVKSNAIVYARDNMTVSVGAGQMSRVYSSKIAAIKANEEGLDLKNSVMASDAFFPFRDSIDTAAAVGISCIIQPGGSIRDSEVIAAANEHNIAMIFTGMRHFRH